MKIRLVLGDITEQQLDVVVNAANSGLLGGGGVDGAIHRVAGPSLAEQCREIRETCGGCATGDAVITTGGNLPAKFVIHTVGPVWHGGEHGEPGLLRNCYRNSLILAEVEKVRTIAFPAISTGVYNYPTEKAAKIAFEAVRGHQAESIEEVVFVLFSEPDFRIYQAIADGF